MSLVKNSVKCARICSQFGVVFPSNNCQYSWQSFSCCISTKRSRQQGIKTLIELPKRTHQLNLREETTPSVWIFPHIHLQPAHTPRPSNWAVRGKAIDPQNDQQWSNIHQLCFTPPQGRSPSARQAAAPPCARPFCCRQSHRQHWLRYQRLPAYPSLCSPEALPKHCSRKQIVVCHWG